jgi:hypothetical protein
VSYADEVSGVSAGACADAAPVSPERLSTVRPGEQIRILLEGANVVRPQDGGAAVHPSAARGGRSP